MNNPAVRTLHDRLQAGFRRLPGLLLAGLLLSYSPGCALISNTPPSAEPDSMIGKPPPVDHDPFAVISLPADATPIAHQGIIGEEIDTEPPPLSPEPDSKEEKTTVAAIAQPEISKPEPTPEPEAPSSPGQAGCFSCVQICPLDHSAPDCKNAPQDMICGWGTSPNIEQAREVARAQCNATLDMARDMPMYSRIEGECPPATCR